MCACWLGACAAALRKFLKLSASKPKKLQVLQIVKNTTHLRHRSMDCCVLLKIIITLLLNYDVFDLINKVRCSSLACGVSSDCVRV